MSRNSDYTARVPQITKEKLLAKFEQVDGVVWPVNGDEPMSANITISGEVFTHKHIAFYIKNPHFLPDIPIKRMPISKDILDRYFEVRDDELVNKQSGAVISVDTIRLGPQYKSISRKKAIRYLKGMEAARINMTEAIKSQQEMLDLIHAQTRRIATLETRYAELYDRLERLAL